MSAPYYPGGYPGQPVYPPAGYPAPVPAGAYYSGAPAPGGAPLPPGVVAQPHWGAPPAATPPGYPSGPPMPPQYGPPAGGQPPQTFDNQRIPATAEWPPELHGRTLAEARRYYGIMRQDFVARRAQETGQVPLAGQPGQAGPAGQPGQPNGAPGYGQPAGGAPDPIRRTVDEAIAHALPSALAPYTRNAGQMAYERVRAAFPDWHVYDSEIQGYLNGSPAEMLANPQTWELAYDLVRGRRLRAQPPGYGQPNGGGAPTFPGAAPGYPGSTGGPPSPGWGPPAPTGYGGPPAPPQTNYFTEAPTPPAPSSGAPADPRDEMFAARFGIPVELYRAARANPDAAARASLEARQRGQPGTPPMVAPPGYGGGGYPPQGYPMSAPPGYGPPYYGPPAPPQPVHYGPPSAYGGMTTPNGGYFGVR